MRKKLFLISNIIVTIFFFLLTGCRSNQVFFQTGTYANDSRAITFSDNGEWRQKGNKIYINDDVYTINGNVLQYKNENLKRISFLSGIYKSDIDENRYFSFSSNNTYKYIYNDEEREGVWEQKDNKIILDGKYMFTNYNNLIQCKEKFYNNRENIFSDLQLYESFIMEPNLQSDTIYTMSGLTIDLEQLFPDMTRFSIKKKTVKDNVIEEVNVDDSESLLREGGKITSFLTKGNQLTINQSDGKDEAEIEVERQDGSKNTYKIIYDCNCN